MRRTSLWPKDSPNIPLLPRDTYVLSGRGFYCFNSKLHEQFVCVVVLFNKEIWSLYKILTATSSYVQYMQTHTIFVIINKIGQTVWKCIGLFIGFTKYMYISKPLCVLACWDPCIKLLQCCITFRKPFVLPLPFHHPTFLHDPHNVT